MAERGGRRSRWRRIGDIRAAEHRGRHSYLRFVTPFIVARCSRRSGVFAAAYDLARLHTLEVAVRDGLKAELEWFQEHLPVPQRSAFCRGKGISWFKRDAQGCIRRLWKLVRLLRDHGVVVECIRTGKPGEIRYEDSLQIVAIPFADTAG
jgi:hypothetical protein